MEASSGIYVLQLPLSVLSCVAQEVKWDSLCLALLRVTLDIYWAPIRILGSPWEVALPPAVHPHAQLFVELTISDNTISSATKGIPFVQPSHCLYSILPGR